MSGSSSPLDSAVSAAPHDDRSNSFGPASVLIYLLVSVMFSGIYLQMTAQWSDADYAGFVRLPSAYRSSVFIFRYRVLVPLLARAAAYLIPVDLAWIFRVLTTAFVFGSLVAYRKYLSNFMRAGFATVLALALLYPMIWNLCLLNDLYLPFDVPSVMLFTLGCHFIYRRSWGAYYAVLALATLNRETSCLLILAFLFTMWGELRKGALLSHLLAQVATWVAIKGLEYVVIGGNQRVFSTSRFSMNVRCLRDMLVLKNSGLKDVIKLALCCGGVYWLIPWLLPGQPRFVKRILLTAVPFLILVMVMAIVDEVRGYLEVMPLVLTPLIYRVAGSLGGTVPPKSHA